MLQPEPRKAGLTDDAVLRSDRLVKGQKIILDCCNALVLAFPMTKAPSCASRARSGLQIVVNGVAAKKTVRRCLRNQRGNSHRQHLCRHALLDVGDPIISISNHQPLPILNAGNCPSLRRQ